MPKEIILPVIAADFESGTIEAWSKTEGDAVKKGEVLVSVETDKAIVEVEAEDSGVLGKILVPAGTEDVPVNAVIGLLLQEGESIVDLDDSTGSVASRISPSISAPTPVLEEFPGGRLAMIESNATSPDPDNSRAFSSPLARRIAANLDVDITTLLGRGPNGRVLKADVDLAKSTCSFPAEVSSVGTVSTAVPMSNQPYTATPHSNMRKAIARRLSESKREVPHFYLSIDCRMDALMSMREELNASSPHGAAAYKLSVNDFVVKCCALAMREFPTVNSSWTDEAIHQHHNVDISVAVATEGGLITPIVQNADSRGLVSISSQIKDLAERARAGKLKPAEFQGGGFTISNLGMYGISNFSAIINPPQSCILAVGAGDQRAVIKDGELAIATVMTCTLSADHRSVNGDVAAQFMQEFKRYIEDPFYMVASHIR